jgi:predicted cobalt transporter CbtA
MMKSLVLRGAGAGAIGGLAALVVARLTAEPLIGRAIDYEDGRDEAADALARAAGQAPEAAGPDLVSRGVQSTLGIGVGTIALGIGLGLLVALAFALCHGRVGRVGPRALALMVAAAGFVTLYLVPFLKYPANPPAVGHENTIAERSGLYLLMVLVSVVIAVAAVAGGRRLTARFGTWNATLLAAGGAIVVLGVVMALLPSLGELAANVTSYGEHATETPQPLTDPAGRIVFPGFDADLLYSFRLASLATQAVLWTVLGLVFAPLAERVVAPRENRAESGAPAPVPV